MIKQKLRTDAKSKGSYSRFSSRMRNRKDIKFGLLSGDQERSNFLKGGCIIGRSVGCRRSRGVGNNKLDGVISIDNISRRRHQTLEDEWRHILRSGDLIYRATTKWLFACSWLKGMHKRSTWELGS